MQGGGGGGGFLFLIPWLMRSRFGRIILVLGALFFVGRWLLLGGVGGQSLQGPTSSQTGTQPETPEVHFVSFVLDDVQSAWTSEFAQDGLPPYRHAKLVLFTDATQTGCGFGQAATGPFYCPNDERVYIDLGFFNELADKLGAKGQFAEAYVLAHEIGHHIQKQLGTTDRVEAMRSKGGDTGATGASVRLELQADCYAGIWAHSTQQRDLLEQGDIESAIGAAAAVGDDRLQRRATGTVSPDSWTHGSSEERMRWFKRGYASGALKDCDTFSATQL
jgi:hypothetical protein